MHIAGTAMTLIRPCEDGSVKFTGFIATPVEWTADKPLSSDDLFQGALKIAEARHMSETLLLAGDYDRYGLRPKILGILLLELADYPFATGWSASEMELFILSAMGQYDLEIPANRRKQYVSFLNAVV